jgi:tetrahydromethanopterin S-methyltransferase subunit G
MPTALPQSVRAKLGDEAADDFTRWIDRAVRERVVPRDEYREVLSRLDVVEQRLDGVESELAQQRQETNELRREMNERFDQMEAWFDQRLGKTNDRIDQMNERFDQMHEQMRVQTRWAIGILALFGTMTTVLLAIAVFGS